MKKIVVIAIVFVLTGCSQQKSIDIEFYDKVEVNTVNDSCELIMSFAGEGVKPENIKDRNLIIEKDKVVCPEMKFDKLGTFELIYQVNGKKVNHIVQIVDETPPIANIESTYEVEVGNKYFDISKEIEANDNFSEVIIDVKGDINLEEVGVYTVVISISDIAGNQLNKTVKVKVVDKEKEIIEVIVEKPSTSNGGNSNNSNSGNNNTGSANTGSTNTGNSSGQVAPGSNNVTPTPFLNGVKNISVSVNSSVGDLAFKLQNGVTASSSISIDYGSVNLSVPGSYTVYYYTDDGQSATCKVEVVE